MTLIEGFGDEVVQFMGVVLTMMVGILAWWSTNARPDRYRTVLVMRSRPHHPVTVSIRPRSQLMLMNHQTNQTTQASTSETTGTSTPEVQETSRDNARVIPLQEMDSIVDADMAMLDNNRLHFYRRMDSPNSTQNTSDSSNDENDAQEDAGNAQIREMDSIVSAMEADVTSGCDLFTRAPAAIQTSSEVKNDTSNDGPSSTTNNTLTDNSIITPVNAPILPERDETKRILIKLKYLNDTLKEVDGNLDELLKDFKLRHFSTELSSECRIRLIFNGRVLVDDAATLQACGLHDRAVVHCLVHPKRPGQAVNEESNGTATHELITERPQPERSWDLENILMTLVSVALTIVWFFRCEYSNMFTASASVALFGLTVFYSVAIFGLYLSDTFQFDRRNPQPTPNN